MCFADHCWCLSAGSDRHRSSIRESLLGGLSVVPHGPNGLYQKAGGGSLTLQSITDGEHRWKSTSVCDNGVISSELARNWHGSADGDADESRLKKIWQ
jgi:hypothetical protein